MGFFSWLFGKKKKIEEKGTLLGAQEYPRLGNNPNCVWGDPNCAGCIYFWAEET